MFQAVCFDFDYTLGDCTESIIAGFRHGLTALGWPEPDREAIRATIGYLLEDAYTMLTPETRTRKTGRNSARSFWKWPRSASAGRPLCSPVLRSCCAA